MANKIFITKTNFLTKGRVIKTDSSSFIPYKPFTSNKQYKKAIKDAGQNPDGFTLPKRPESYLKF